MSVPQNLQSAKADEDDIVGPDEQSAIQLDRIEIPDIVSQSGDVLTARTTSADQETLDLVGILSAVQETAYIWDIGSDRIDWECNAAEILGMPDIGKVVTGAAFQLMIASEHIGRRHEVIEGATSPDSGKGVPYRVQYRFMPNGRRSDKSLWLEDHGRWWADSNGRPTRARGVIRVINERYWEEQRLLYRSDHDELTGQLNRIRLTEALGAVVAHSQKTGEPCAFLIAAVNNLSVINETFGFDVGDEVIAGTAKVIKRRLRGGDSIGRYSSNKFGIILHDCTLGSLRAASERFLLGVREATLKTSACHVAATISLGGVLLPEQAATAQNAISNALWALDRAKAKRQGNLMVYEPSANMESTRRRNIAIADDVISALDENRMMLALQPIVNSLTREADLMECLLRIEQADGSLRPAGEFIEVAEQLGLSRLIDRRTLELATDILKKQPEIKLSLNVSGLTAGDHDWLVALHRLTGGRRQITERLWIEITETAALDDLDQTINFVDTLKELGCKVAIDDFGAGYTSFKNLKLLNVDMVKIDGSFVENLAGNAADRIFIKTMVELAQSFGMDTVAEWVGDEATATFLRDAGITHMQGFFLGRPKMASDLFAASAPAKVEKS